MSSKSAQKKLLTIQNANGNKYEGKTIVEIFTIQRVPNIKCGSEIIVFEFLINFNKNRYFWIPNM